MKEKAVIGILVVLVTGVLWLAPDSARSQDHSGPGNGRPSIEFPHPSFSVHPATITDRLVWSGISLINPRSEKKPVFLYSYRLSDLDTPAVREMLSEAMAYNIRIAIIEPSSNGDGTYEGRAALIPDNSLGQDIRAFTDTLPLMVEEPGSDRRFVALSRPLHAFSNNVEMQEFVTEPGFWRHVDPEP